MCSRNLPGRTRLLRSRFGTNARQGSSWPSRFSASRRNRAEEPVGKTPRFGCPPPRSPPRTRRGFRGRGRRTRTRKVAHLVFLTQALNLARLALGLQVKNLLVSNGCRVEPAGQKLPKSFRQTSVRSEGGR